MNQAYSKELRADTAIILIPIIAAATAVGCLLGAIAMETFSDSWHLWLSLALSISSGSVAWHALKQEKQFRGTLLFTAVHLLIFFLIILNHWTPGSAFPYFFAVLIIASSMYTRPDYGFLTWFLSAVLTIVAVSGHAIGIWDLLNYIAGPVILNLFVAAAAYLSALEWQFAVESVSALHIKAQHRRDELFAIQEALSKANGRLRVVNEELEKARAAAVAERDLRTRFMHQVSHELRTPINTIVNFAHILGQGELGSVSQQQIDYLGRIEKSGWHSMSVLNDLLDLAQMNAGEFRLKLELINPQAICEEVMSSTRGLLRNPAIALVRDYPEVWPELLVDPKRFQQALLNLLSNAAKYTDEGQIILRVRCHENSAIFAIEDSGIGIPEAHLETIFEEFRQLDETIARQRIGTGLGLPISRQLIERHGGTLTVASQVGQGSTFTITLPLAHLNDTNGKAAAPAPDPVIAPERPF